MEDDFLLDEGETVEIVDEELLRKQRIHAMRVKVAHKSKHKGSRYENALRSKIASYFGIAPENAFILAKNHPQEGQSAGDLIPVKEMAKFWYSRGLGAIEAKNREEWAFSQFFNGDIKKNPIYKYWLKSNEDTGSENSLVFFTKNHVPDFVFHKLDGNVANGSCYFCVRIQGEDFVIQPLGQFLQVNFPQD